MVVEYSFPTRIRLGAGCSLELGDRLVERGIRRPLIITDRGVVALDFFQEQIDHLNRQPLDIDIYNDFGGNPLVSHVEAGVEAARAHKADGLVLFGGGAALDVGKAIGLMLHHPGQLFDYEDGHECRPIDERIPPLIAVPTTAGTGSEVGRSSVISDDVTKVKKIIFSPRLLPELVLADPTLTLDLPPSITAATGLDALSHHLEAFVAKGFHPMCQGIAWQGIHMISRALPQVMLNPHDIDARTQMLMASLMGAVAFQKGLGVNHSCAHALSTCFDLHHGLANGLMLEATLRFNAQVVEEEYAQLAFAAGIRESDDDKAVAGLIDWYVRLKESCGINRTLKDFGVEISDDLINAASSDGCHILNPRPVTRKDFVHIFEAAF